jgi:hypothetical protein
MSDTSTIIRQRQLAIRREMDRRGLLLKIVAQDSGIPYPTLATYFPADPHAEPAQIPGGAIYALADSKALPADLLSDLMPEGWAIVRVPEGIDHDAIAEWAEAYQARKLAAHRADSECAEQIGPTEHTELNAIVVAFPVKAA